jgi:dethiobiotin synthase
MRNQFFVTGTDTGIGKTVVSALLCAAASARYWKPIQTGASEGTDREAVIRYAELPPESTLPETYCFREPVSPHLAARWAGTRIDLETVPRSNVSGADALIVEGAGGVLVPINDRQFMTDLITWLRLPVLLVCRSALGTINHTLLSLAALRASGAEVRGLVMVGARNQDNQEALENYGKVPVVGALPWLAEINRSQLVQEFHRSFDPSLLD